MIERFCAAAAASLVAFAAPAQAETLKVEGLYGARDDATAALQTIWMDDFSGSDGDRLSRAIFQEVSKATVEGEPYFRIAMTPPEIDAVSEDQLPDAYFRGLADVGISDVENGTKEEERCAAKDKDGKCIRKRKIYHVCHLMTVSLSADAYLLYPDGEQLYGRSDTLSSSKRYCADEYSQPDPFKMASGLIDRFARNVRYDVAPVFRREDFRVLESRKGLSKDDRKIFKQALRLTKNDELAACMLFEDLLLRNDQQMSVRFNTGLCREADGNLDAAEIAYRKAMDIDPDKSQVEDGLRRIVQRRRALAQLETHSAPLLSDAEVADEAEIAAMLSADADAVEEAAE